MIVGVMDPEAPELKAFRIADKQIEEAPLQLLE